MLPKLSFLHGKPQSTGLLRQQKSDFKVFEQLPFLPCGEGEHLFIHIRKIGANTVFVARELAKYFKVKEQLVSYAGLKDRFAVTEQWFGVHVPGKQEYDLKDLSIEGVEILSYKRHNKKLRTGALTGNRFELILREITDLKALNQRWEKIVREGVPNYFGEQRFGIDGMILDIEQLRGVYIDFVNRNRTSRIGPVTEIEIIDGDTRVNPRDVAGKTDHDVVVGGKIVECVAGEVDRGGVVARVCSSQRC